MIDGTSAKAQPMRLSIRLQRCTDLWFHGMSRKWHLQALPAAGTHIDHRPKAMSNQSTLGSPFRTVPTAPSLVGLHSKERSSEIHLGSHGNKERSQL
jgi:hypothetical protein